MPVDDQTLSKLLRLKRFEQPPAGYYEDFLREFQARQRVELLRRPLWRILLDRWTAFREEYFTLPHFAYATASAAVLCVAGALTFNMLQHPGSGVRSSAQALAGNPMIAAAQPVAYAGPAARPGINNALTPQIRIPDALMESSFPPAAGDEQHPRYILDTRPASYEPPFSF
ncbi:MAG: hypothetical protein PHQ12_10150 [Chthoniobacteraceae bacterium]|nr:hypothetical protein [Chthoniobacteraceae bacterium]